MTNAHGYTARDKRSPHALPAVLAFGTHVKFYKLAERWRALRGGDVPAPVEIERRRGDIIGLKVEDWKGSTSAPATARDRKSSAKPRRE